MTNLLSIYQAENLAKVDIEERLARDHWTDEEFKLLTPCLTYTHYDRPQALLTLSIEIY